MMHVGTTEAGGPSLQAPGEVPLQPLKPSPRKDAPSRTSFVFPTYSEPLALLPPAPTWQHITAVRTQATNPQLEKMRY